MELKEVGRCGKDVYTCATKTSLSGARHDKKPSADCNHLENCKLGVAFVGIVGKWEGADWPLRTAGQDKPSGKGR